MVVDNSVNDSVNNIVGDVADLTNIDIDNITSLDNLDNDEIDKFINDNNLADKQITLYKKAGLLIIKFDNEYYKITNTKIIDKIEGTKLDSINISELLDLLKLQSQVENSIENQSTINILEGTNFEEKMGNNFEKIGKKIEKAVITYLKGLFDEDFYKKNSEILDKMFKSWSTGIQFSMIEKIEKMDNAEANTDFFADFGNINFNKTIKTFTGLFKTFNQGNEFISLAKNVENCCQFLASNKDDLIKSKSPLLYNAYYFKNMLSAPIRLSSDNFEGKNMSNIKISVDGKKINLYDENNKENLKLTDEQKKKFQAIANNQELLDKINQEFVEKIAKDGGIVDNALDFLGKRGKYQKDANELYETIDNIFNFNIPILSSLGLDSKSILGYDNISDFLNSDKHKNLKSVVDFVLGILGFQGGFAGLDKKYKTEKLQKLVKNNDFVKNGLKGYSNIDENVGYETPNSTFSILDLKNINTNYEDEDIAKIVPQDFAGMKKILNNILTEKINISKDLYSIDGLSSYMKKNKDGTIHIPDNSKEYFSDLYLKSMIKKLLLNENLIKEINNSTNPKKTFMTVLLGTIQAGDLFRNAHDLRTLNDFLDDNSDNNNNINSDNNNSDNNQNNINQNNQNNLAMKKKKFEEFKDKSLNKLTFDEAKNLALLIFGKGPGTDLLIKYSDTKPEFITRTIALAYHENRLKFNKINQAVVQDGNGGYKKNSNTGYDIGTFQIHSTGSQKDAWRNYNKLLDKGINLTGETINKDELSGPQKDLLAWFGHIDSRNNRSDNQGINIFDNLASDNIFEDKLKELIYHKIQGGDKLIGDAVIKNLNKNVISYFQNNDNIDIDTNIGLLT